MSNSTVFKSDVYATVNGKFQPVGQVESTYLIDQNGNHIINPSTGKPYIIPFGYNPENTIGRFSELNQAQPGNKRGK